MELILEVIRTLISVLTLVSIIIAYLALKTNKAKIEEDRNITKDKEIYQQAIHSLKWSYEVLTLQMENLVPQPNRLNWLTAARHIQRYYKLKALIKTDTYKLLNEEIEEYWRHSFYQLLDNQTMDNKSYFMAKDDQQWPENIEITSAMIISEFSQWDESIEDPINTADKDKLIEKGAFNGFFGRGLKSYTENLNMGDDK
jgi:hypothetical protein